MGGAHLFSLHFQARDGPHVIGLGHDDIFLIFHALLFFADMFFLLFFRIWGGEIMYNMIMLFELPDVEAVLSPTRQLIGPRQPGVLFNRRANGI